MYHPSLMSDAFSGVNPAFVAAYIGFVAIFTLVAIVFGLIVQWRIASKAGYSGAMSLLLLVPLVNIVMIVLFAFTEWPVQRALREATGMPLPPPGGYVPPGGGGYAPALAATPSAHNPYANPRAAVVPQAQPYGVPPPPPQAQWPADPPETL